jgi:nucleoid-associated protein EbfC
VSPANYTEAHGEDGGSQRFFQSKFMLENIFGNVQQQQADLQRQLGEQTVQAESGDGAVQVTATANFEIQNIKIDAAKFGLAATEELEDLLLVAINRVIEEARRAQGEASAKMIKDMFPFGDLDQFMKG